MSNQTPPEAPPSAQVVSGIPVKLKLWQSDHQKATDLVNAVSQSIPTMTFNNILREAIHVGLPEVEKKYRAMNKVAEDNQ